MIVATDTLVLLLAGGVGSRLNILVQSRAKPAVPFAGLYRIIDFSLSNCMHAGVRHVGVLTQYKPLSLMRHIGTGEPWDFIGRRRQVKILPPRTGHQNADWYQGTADAIRQNLDFIKEHPSREIIILSGDHIYQMDLLAMLDCHRRKQADITIAMMRVQGDAIRQFGTGITDTSGRIVEWEEKPEHPRTDLASMGIYVFDTDYLVSLLTEDKDEVDFGMHLIPKAVNRDHVYAFPFTGYWRDVGTISAYWDANMDLLRPGTILTPEKWGVRPNPHSGRFLDDRPPARFRRSAVATTAMISAGCRIEGSVVNSILSPGVHVRKGAVVRDSILFEDCVVAEGAVVDFAIIDKRVRVGKKSIVGHGDKNAAPNHLHPTHLDTGLSLVGKEAEIPPQTVIGRNCIISPQIHPDEYPAEVIASGETVHSRS